MPINTNTIKVKVGNITIGGSNHVVIQSMCNIKTSNIEQVVAQINKLESYGCELIRVSILDENDAYALKTIKSKINIPIVADIHFDYKLALLAVENGANKIRINPGNIGSIENIKKVVLACKEKHIPIRIGINEGSLEKDLLDKYGLTPKTFIESAKRQVKILESLDFKDIIISLKTTDIELTKKTYELASEEFIYPLHIGVTEPGPMIPGIVKSTLALSYLLSKGIGSTIRISLSEDPIYEIKVARQLLASLNLAKLPKLISCPTCGRTNIDVLKYANIIEDYLYKVNKDITVAVMGCVVNGPGEAAFADIGIAGGNHEAVIFKKGKVVKTVKEENILESLIQEIDSI